MWKYISQRHKGGTSIRGRWLSRLWQLVCNKRLSRNAHIKWCTGQRKKVEATLHVWIFFHHPLLETPDTWPFPRAQTLLINFYWLPLSIIQECHSKRNQSIGNRSDRTSFEHPSLFLRRRLSRPKTPVVCRLSFLPFEKIDPVLICAGVVQDVLFVKAEILWKRLHGGNDELAQWGGSLVWVPTQSCSCSPLVTQAVILLKRSCF